MYFPNSSIFLSPYVSTFLYISLVNVFQKYIHWYLTTASNFFIIYLKHCVSTLLIKLYQTRYYKCSVYVSGRKKESRVIHYENPTFIIKRKQKPAVKAAPRDRTRAHLSPVWTREQGCEYWSHTALQWSCLWVRAETPLSMQSMCNTSLEHLEKISYRVNSIRSSVQNSIVFFIGFDRLCRACLKRDRECHSRFLYCFCFLHLLERLFLSSLP